MLRLTRVILVGVLIASCTHEESYDHGFSIDDSQWSLADEQADLTKLRSALEEIESWHSRSRTGIQLNTPLPEQEFLELSAQFPCSLPREVEALWKWKNGESTDYFIWYHGFLPLQEAVEQYQYLVSEPIFGWKKNWIPVFQFQDEWNFVECKTERVTGVPVIHYFTESGPSYAYTNLTSYMNTMAAAMDRGVLTWEEGWWSNADSEKELAAVHGEYNERARFPYAVE